MVQIGSHAERIDIPSLGDECYRRLKYDIVNGHLDWGTKLNVVELANRFGISRSPVVKAIDRLAMVGLVRIFPNKGSFVLIPTAEQISETLEAAEILATSLYRLAFAKNRADLVIDLGQLTLPIKQKLEQRTDLTVWEYFEYEQDFQQILCYYARNDRLSKLYQILCAQVELLSVHSLSTEQLEHAVYNHAAVIEWLAADQPDQALKGVSKQFQTTQQRILAYLANHEGEFIYR